MLPKVLKFHMLHAKPEVQLSRVEENDFLLILGCNCVISFVFQAIVDGVEVMVETLHGVDRQAHGSS